MADLKILEEVTLSTEVVLGVGQARPFVIHHIGKRERAKEPKVPVMFIEAKEREEENPHDPDYLAAYEEWEVDATNAIMGALIGLATCIVSVPKGFDKPAQKGWQETMEAIGVEVPKGETARYIAWVRYWAIQGNEDLQMLAKALRRQNGIPEEEVADAADSFPDNEERDTD